MSTKIFDYDEFKQQQAIDKLYVQVQGFIKSQCETDDVGDLPVDFMLRSRQLHYPFNDCFLIPKDEKEIERAIDLQIINVSAAVARLTSLQHLKRIYTKK